MFKVQFDLTGGDYWVDDTFGDNKYPTKDDAEKRIEDIKKMYSGITFDFRIVEA